MIWPYFFLQYICQYEKSNYLDSSNRDGAFFSGAALHADKVYRRDGAYEERTV